MIRVHKHSIIPASLQVEGCSNYDGQDVQEQLVVDQHEKCYLCEQITGKDFQIEHLKPKAEDHHPELKYTWTNLFLACPFCNGRKPNSSKILDPSQNDIETIIDQKIDFSNRKIVFTGDTAQIEIKDTIKLLDKLMNGKKGIRDIKTQLLYKDIEREISFFLSLLINFSDDPCDVNRNAIMDSLNIKKEFLGLKYNLLKENVALADEFSEYILWSKTA